MGVETTFDAWKSALEQIKANEQNVYEAGKKEGQESGAGIDISDRTNLAMWYQSYAYPLVSTLYYDPEDYNQEWPMNGRPSDAGVPVFESLPFPTGTQNITDFGLFTKVLAYEWWDSLWSEGLTYISIWVKRFTGTLDISGTTSIESLFSGIVELEECPSLSNTSHIATFSGLFSSCRNLLYVPALDLSSASGITSMFSGCNSLHTIENLILPRNDKFRSWVYTFSGCSSLVNLTFTGTNSVTGLDLSKSTKLSKASITSVINSLSTATSGRTVTFSKTAKENAFTSAEWQALIATRSNWTISLV